MNTRMLVVLAGAYVLGSIPFGFLAGRLKGIDIRTRGSGNIGATNVFRVMGKKWGIAVLALDALKGFFAVALARLTVESPGDSVFLPTAGVAAILGHSFPVWLRFKGGKGVATSLGVFLGISWVPTMAAFFLWTLVFTTGRIISAASLVAAAAFPLFCYFWADKAMSPILVPISLFLTAFILYTHRDNIGRLLRKEEKRLF